MTTSRNLPRSLTLRDDSEEKQSCFFCLLAVSCSHILLSDWHRNAGGLIHCTTSQWQGAWRDVLRDPHRLSEVSGRPASSVTVAWYTWHVKGQKVSTGIMNGFYMHDPSSWVYKVFRFRISIIQDASDLSPCPFFLTFCVSACCGIKCSQPDLRIMLAAAIATLRVTMLALPILPNVYLLDSMLSSGLELFQVSLGMELCDETLPRTFTFDLGHSTSLHGTWTGLAGNKEWV